MKQLHLFTLLATLFDNQHFLVNQFICYENLMYRKRIKASRIVPSTEERAILLLIGKRLGPSLKDHISVVDYKTFLHWVHLEKNQTKLKNPKRQRGRPLKDPERRKLVIKMARENIWGYTRIYGELKKLGRNVFSRTTIANILKQNNLPPLGRRTEPFYKTLSRHYDTLVACDFFKQWTWTLQGPRLVFILFYINIQTRKVKLAGITKYPKGDWVLEKTQNVFQDQSFAPGKKKVLIHDLDRKFPKSLDHYLESNGFRVLKTPYRSPNMNAYAESWVGKIRSECLDHFVVFGMKHLNYLVEEYIHYHNTKRPHMNKDFLPLAKTNHQNNLSTGANEAKVERVRGSPILGGLHHDYKWK